MEEINIDRIGFNGDKARLILPDGYEFKAEGNEAFVIKKKPRYPKTYEDDKEKSTFENIVFKKVDEVVIKWNQKYNGVEIKADGEHFILDSNPSYCMTWNESIRFYNNKQRCHIWNLPTTKQLQVVCKYFNEINRVIKENRGFVLYKLFYWGIEEVDAFRAWGIYMGTGDVYGDDKYGYNYVRAVYTL